MSFPRYPEYRDSGVEWLGEVPGHWESWKISHAFRQIGSGTTPPSNEAIWYDKGEIPWVTTGELRENVITSTAKCVTREAVERFGSLRIYPPGSLVVAMYGATIGRLGVLGIHAATNQACCVLACPANLAVRFVFHWLSAFKERLIDLYSYGGGQPNISQEVVARLRIPAPSIDEQLSIASFLDRETAKIDALVAEQQSLIALLKEKRQALISNAVTTGLDPDVPMKDSGVAWLGKVPAPWTVAPIKYLVKFRSGGTPSKDRLDYWDGELPWASAKDLKMDRLLDTADHISETAIDEGAANLLDAGTVLIVVRGMILARTFPVALIGSRMAINQDLKGLEPNPKMLPEFLAWYLRGTAAESLSRLDEAGHGTKALRMDAWASLEVSLPPLDEQVAINESVDRETARIDELTSEAESTIALLQERRTALVSAAVTGKIDVRHVAATSAEEPA